MENILSTKLEIALTNGTKGHGKYLYKQYIVPKKGSHFMCVKTNILIHILSNVHDQGMKIIDILLY